jgi:hypothetical protein
MSTQIKMALLRVVSGACLVATVSASCAFDPTEQAVAVSIKNDLHAQARIALCEDDQCHRLQLGSHFRGELRPQAVTGVNVSSWGVPETYRVVVAGSSEVACLHLLLNGEPAKRPVYLLSHSVICTNQSQVDRTP